MSSDESGSDGEDSEPHLDENLPCTHTFKVDCDIDITSQVLRDMVSTEHSVGPLIPLQCTSFNVREAPETSGAQPDWDW